MDCVFCKIVAGALPADKIYEDDEYLAFLDIKPINPGHTLIVPKKHSKDMADTPDEVLRQMAVLTKRVGRALMAATGAEGFNLGVNNGTAAGQVVFHLHFHVMPRFSRDHFKLWTGRDYAEGEAKSIANSIRKNL